MKRLLLFCSLALIVLSAKADSIQAQHWKNIGNFQWPGPVAKSGAVNAPHITAINFLNAKTGFVAVSTYYPNLAPGFVPEIFRTTDGGKSWAQASIPVDQASQAVMIQDLYMQDQSVGYAAVNHGSPFYGGVWKTTDGGMHWSGLPNSPACASVRPLTGTRLATSGGGLALKNSAEALTTPAVASIPTITVATSTHDAGTTWNTGSTDIRESWGVYYNETNDNFYICPEHAAKPPLVSGSIYTTQDFGDTWQSVTGLPNNFGSTGDINGYRNTFYVQSGINNLPLTTNAGVWRTRDAGRTFIPVGGPSSLLDTRISVPPTCSGGTVIVGDSTDLWMTTDGGDGLLGSSPLDVAVQQPTKVSTCGRDSIKVSLTNAGCYSIRVTSISIDSTEYFQFLKSPMLPDSIAVGSSDSIKIAFNPHLVPGVHTVHIHLTGILGNDSAGAPYDSTITLQVRATPQPPQLLASTYFLDLGDVSICGSVDTLIMLRNSGCDTLTIDSLSGNLGKEVNLAGLKLPLRLAPGDSVKVGIAVSLDAVGTVNRQVALHSSQQGLTNSFDILFRANGVINSGRISLSSATLDAGSLSYCVGDTTLGSVLKLVGCDSLVVSNFRFVGSPAFTLTSPTQDTIIGSDSAYPIRVRFKPLVKGKVSGVLTFHVRGLRSADPGHDTSITIVGFGLGGAKILSVEQDTFFLGTISFCQSSDTLSVLKNLGCDTLTILRGSFDNPEYYSSTTFPQRLAPGGSMKVPVHLKVDTTNHPLSINGVFTVTTDADSASVRTLRFGARIIYPIKLRLELTKVDSATAGGSATFHLGLVGDKPTNIAALHFDLTHDDDLLGFKKFAGSGLSLDGSAITNGVMTQSFTYFPVSDTGTVGDFFFDVFLSKNAKTPLTIRNVHFDTPEQVQPDCIATITDSGSSFSYIYRCTDSLIQSALKSQPLRIDRISPNPTHGLLVVKLSRKPVYPVRYEVVDLLGNTIFETTISEARIRIDLDLLAVGAFYLRSSSREFVETRKILIVR
jgi:hypothetical protein